MTDGDPNLADLATTLEAGWMALTASSVQVEPRTEAVAQKVVASLVAHGRSLAAAGRRQEARDLVDGARRSETGPHEAIWNRMMNTVLDHF